MEIDFGNFHETLSTLNFSVKLFLRANSFKFLKCTKNCCYPLRNCCSTLKSARLFIICRQYYPLKKLRAIHCSAEKEGGLAHRHYCLQKVTARMVKSYGLKILTRRILYYITQNCLKQDRTQGGKRKQTKLKNWVSNASSLSTISLPLIVQKYK